MPRVNPSPPPPALEPLHTIHYCKPHHKIFCNFMPRVNPPPHLNPYTLYTSVNPTIKCLTVICQYSPTPLEPHLPRTLVHATHLAESLRTSILVILVPSSFKNVFKFSGSSILKRQSKLTQPELNSDHKLHVQHTTDFYFSYSSTNLTLFSCILKTSEHTSPSNFHRHERRPSHLIALQ